MNATRIIHFTDTHVATPGDMVYGNDPSLVLRACIERINADPFGGDICVVTGDLVHYGAPERYAALRSELDRLEMPYRLLIGNSDDRALFVAAFPDHPRDRHGFVQSTCDLGSHRLIFLDTVDPSVDPAGRLGNVRLEWLEKELAEAADASVLLFMHHPPFEMYSPHQDELGLLDKQAFRQVIARHGNVRHVFFGHTHRPIAGSWRGISFSSLRGMQMDCALVQDSADPALFSCPRGIYACVVVDEDQVIVNDVDLMIEGVQPFPRG
jgi:3',5'-cyclic AMP phosphodiesterase CpdA